ncbi:hypothetical protein LTS10_001615 [Elasticomyces elasticus]|nr:hypothetical protein LTS10_001615 [Elasticomyces elasticus]
MSYQAFEGTSSSSGAEHDLHSGLQTMSTITSEQTYQDAQATNPSATQSNAYFDELRRLRAELQAMQVAKNQAHAAEDAMAVDLMKAQEEIEEKDERLKHMSEDILFWRQKANLGGVTSSDHVKNETELAQARQQVQQLTAALAENNTMLSAKEVNVVDIHELDMLRRRVSDQEGEARDQHQCVEHFKRMSERLTTQVKQANRERQDLERAMQTLREHVDFLQAQAGPSAGPQRGSDDTSVGQTY